MLIDSIPKSAIENIKLFIMKINHCCTKHNNGKTVRIGGEQKKQTNCCPRRTTININTINLSTFRLITIQLFFQIYYHYINISKWQ